MFIQTSNGYLLNVNNIKIIYISVPDEEKGFYSVKAKINDENEITLYKDIELQHVREYIEELGKKIAIM